MARHEDHPGARLRRLMDEGCVAAPGAFNGLVGRAVAQAGFGACYVSGGATSAAAGVPDVGLLSLERFCGVIREVADGSGLPVLADADTGFGEEEMVRRTVIEYERAGAAGLHIEDQVFPKRCGHLDDKTLVPLGHAVSKVEWAVRAARECSGGAFVVCARTDARGVDGFGAAVERGLAYVEAGADMIFPEGLASEEEFGRFAEAMGRAGSGPSGDPAAGTRERERSDGARRGPYLLANMTEFGKTPPIGLAGFGALGYDLVIYPVTMLRVAMGAVTRALSQLREAGTVVPFLEGMQTRAELYDLLGYTPGEAWRYPARRGGSGADGGGPA